MNINDWTIYVRAPAGDSGAGWRWVPLGATEPLTSGKARWAPLKAAREPRQRCGWNTFHLNFSILELRFAKGTDYRELTQREPDLAALLDRVLAAMWRGEESPLGAVDDSENSTCSRAATTKET